MSPLQDIQNGTVVNHHPFGVDLQKFCDSDEAIAILPGHGFMDGGCYALAVALQRHIGENGLRSSLVMVGRPGVVDHIVAAVALPGGAIAYLDADGMADEASLRRKMLELVFIASPDALVVLSPLDSAEAERQGVYDYQAQNVPDALLSLMRRQLGEIDLERLSLDWADTEDNSLSLG